MKLTVHLFAAARDTVGHSHVEVTLSLPATVSALRDALTEQFPQLKPVAPTLLIAVNNQYAAPDDLLNSTDEVACFPPVSGG